MRPATHSHLDGFATASLALDVDDLTPDEILRSLDPHQEGDAALTPWRRRHRAGFRAALQR
jgi:hypothetical protein